jgi:hypothetical protein
MAPRILGRNTILYVHSAKWLLPIALGEIDEFRATSTTELIKSRPVGFSLQSATLRYSGYDLQLKIGKTDPMLARWNHLVDRGLLGGNQPPELFITETITHYRTIPFTNVPLIENWVYKNVNLFGLDVSTSGQGEHEQDIRGFAAWKELGPIDTTFINLQWVAGIGFQEVVVRTNKVGGGIGEDITSTVNSVIDKAFSPRNNTPPPLAGSG